MKLKSRFYSPYILSVNRNGQKFTYLNSIFDADKDHDEEVLPMFRIVFENGEMIEAWPEEIFDFEDDEQYTEDDINDWKDDWKNALLKIGLS